jgi:hypothetical protein
MLMDKYQPLRIKGESNSQHPADAKLASVQKPNMIGSPSFGQPSGSASIADASKLVEDLPPVDAEGRRLAKTPDNKPWRAVYINPMAKVRQDGKPAEASVYYAKYLDKATERRVRGIATGKDRLKMAGIRTENLPTDDRAKMRTLRESVRRWDKAGRMRGIKEEAMEYRRKREESNAGHDALDPMDGLDDEEIEAMLSAEGVLKEGEEMRLSSASDSEAGEAQIGMSGGRGFASIANERIEAAMRTSYFRQNSLRGKPLQYDVHAANPYLQGEERIMNRIIQRQGAAPPWVELNVQVENEQRDFRHRLAENWQRRASRMILATPYLRDGMEYVGVAQDEEFDALQRRSNLTQGQRKTLHIADSYTDAEWEQREQAYHEASLRHVNNLIRKYNVVAPVSARRGLLVREWELKRVRESSRAGLVRMLSNDLLSGPKALHNERGRNGKLDTNDTAYGFAMTSKGDAEVQGRDWTRNTAQRSSRGDGGSSASGKSVDELEQRRRTRPVPSIPFADLVRRTAERARQFVGW